MPYPNRNRKVSGSTTAMIQLEGSRVTCFASFSMIAASCCHQARIRALVSLIVRSSSRGGLPFDERDERVLERRLGMRGALRARLELIGRAFGDLAAAPDESDAIAILGLLREVGGDDDRHPARRERVDVVPERAPRQGRAAAGGGIEKRERRGGARSA